MKLYEIPRNSKILLTIDGPDREEKEEMCTFLHIDGMYSAITTENGAYVHLGASTEVKLVDDHYEIDTSHLEASKIMDKLL
jgi:hypothetical protein